jgi:hypothetical protein
VFGIVTGGVRYRTSNDFLPSNNEHLFDPVKKFILKIISFLIVFVLSNFLVNFSYLSHPPAMQRDADRLYRVGGLGITKDFQPGPFFLR